MGFVIQERLDLSLFYVNDTVLELFLLLLGKKTDIKLRKVSEKVWTYANMSALATTCQVFSQNVLGFF